MSDKLEVALRKLLDKAHFTHDGSIPIDDRPQTVWFIYDEWEDIMMELSALVREG